MAKSGSIQFSYSQSIENNQSVVTVSGIIVTSGDSYRGDSRTGTYTIKKGSTVIKSGSFTHGAPANSTTTLFSVSVTVGHNDDGTCEAITASYDYSSGWCTGSGSLSLPTIARKSTLTVSNGTLGTAQTLSISEKASAFNHKLYYSCGSAGGYILGSSSATSSALSTSWTPPLSLASQNTSGTSVSITFTLYTYSGSTLIGSNSYTNTFSIPSSVAPSCSIELSDYMGYYSTYGGYVKSKSRLKVDITAATSYGSPISSYSSSANGTSYTGSSFITEVLKSSGEMTITSKVTDDRGRSGSDSETINVLDYSAPAITKLSVHRCNSDGTENEQGAYVKVTFSAKVTSLGNKNTAVYKLYYKKTSESDFGNPVTFTSLSNNYDVSDYSYVFAADTSSSYNVKVTAQDVFETSPMSTTVSTARTLLDFYGDRALSLGKVCEVEHGFEIGLPTFLREGYDIKAHYGASNQYDLIKNVDDLNTKLKPDYIKAYRNGSSITCTQQFSIIPLSAQSKYGDTFEFQSDGTILVKKSCHIDISAQVYFATGFTAGDWVAAAICCNGNVNVRTAQYVDRTNPYLMLNLSTKVGMEAGETISLKAMNETAARGAINTGFSDTFLHAHVIAYT